ncbi:MAG: anacyclamide/piricyclamide family prenylated cyclic peptide [Scytonema sp. PMC 1069.18]|nr:anacyclamide/piricyclamide family prenylated cyclic peptide [Scytonema sp. PMC 1069.18]MEC4881527.1 anacyclamide/piricyclamide family prenylated cyclic peptide [Scytonema sp. PMC 1070.18]
MKKKNLQPKQTAPVARDNTASSPTSPCVGNGGVVPHYSPWPGDPFAGDDGGTSYTHHTSYLKKVKPFFHFYWRTICFNKLMNNLCQFVVFRYLARGWCEMGL